MSGLEGGRAEKDQPQLAPRRSADQPHRPRDTVWREDDQQAYLGNGPRVMATFKNLALGLFGIHGITKITRSSEQSDATLSEPFR